MGKGRRSLIVIVLGALMGLMAFGVVGSAAWFTDQASVKDNVIRAGTLDVEIVEEGVDLPFEIDNMAPGETRGPIPFGVYNVGTLNAKYAISATGIGPAEQDLADALVVKLIGYASPNDGTCDQPFATVAYEGPLSGLIAATGHQFGLVIPTGWVYPFKMCFTLPGDTGNSVQGDSVKFNIVVDATQPDAP
ncbi:MAG: TasA family protein [Acidimicrobiia bacterium]